MSANCLPKQNHTTRFVETIESIPTAYNYRSYYQ